MCKLFLLPFFYIKVTIQKALFLKNVLLISLCNFWRWPFFYWNIFTITRLKLRTNHQNGKQICWSTCWLSNFPLNALFSAKQHDKVQSDTNFRWVFIICVLITRDIFIERSFASKSNVFSRRTCRFYNAIICYCRVFQKNIVLNNDIRHMPHIL